MKKIWLALFLLSILGNLSAQQLPPLRNVVVILADDHALKVTGAYGNEIIRTPNIDRFSQEGITFEQAYCNSPICSASRQSLLTGKYPHATGVNLLFTPFPDEGNITIAEHLQKREYKTALIGKSHFNNWAWASLYQEGMPQHGFDQMIEGKHYKDYLHENPPQTIPEHSNYYQRPEDQEDMGAWMNAEALPQPVYDEDSEGTFYARSAVKFLKENKNNPFLLWLAFKEPHHPYYFPIEYAGKYDPEDMPLPEGSPEDDRWIPERFRGLTEDEKRGIIAAYYASTEYLDKNIGLVLKAIDELGLRDNTVVIYISDNGYLLYEHKRFEKHTMWEEATHQPMIIRAGDSYRAGERNSALVEYIDVVPTLLDLVGERRLKEAQGKSFASLLKKGKQEHREYVFSEYLEDNLAMVRTKRWKYMFTTGSRDLGIGYQTGYGPSGIVHRLYDLEADSLESTNVSENPKYADTLRLMQEKMLERFIETHPEADDCPEGLTLEGKLVWFCEPRDVGVDQSLLDKPVRVFEHFKKQKSNLKSQH